MPLALRDSADPSPAVAPANRVYFPALDGFRGVAFLAVFFHHYGYFAFGWFGVDAFFALSGFLITGILFDTMDAPNRVSNFFARRTLRIFPLFYLVFLLTLLITPWAHWHWSAHWLLWPGYLANDIGLIQGRPISQPMRDFINGILRSGHGFSFYFGHFWSLCVEEQFYLVWPWVVFLVRRRETLLKVCLGLMLACPVLRVLAIVFFLPRALETSLLLHGTPFRLDSLIFGAAAALLYRGPHRERLLTWARPLAWLAGVLFLVSLHPPRFWYSDPVSFFIESVGFSLIALLSTAVILRALTPASRFYRVFHLRPLRWVGRISYGAYVFHDIPHELYRLIAHTHRSGTTLIALPCTLVLASLSYRYFESPFLRLKPKAAASGEPLTPAPAQAS